ncbi:uncharacterized protein LOC123556093 isoform X2 [Mercenaria mercenaria]|uniref:uncharacterized protein LOC123556093 isoform X2 n=1 Tax=Mercenaria mercenaria TaxID=6596 RepID=UPI001E1D978A|nr:uncharacterized protein LOC123556093 isoform X2 [Mercenaria mercenaria]
MLLNKGLEKWTNLKELINRGITVSNAGNENTVEFVNIVKDVHKAVYLYGDEILDSLPQSSKKQTLGLFGLNKERFGKVDTEEEASKAKEEFLQLENKIYRNQTVKFIYDEKAKTSSLSTTRVRQRLCDLMGTDVIRLNDKRYFQTLTQRLQDEYETIMDKQEDARAASEHERLRRLMLEGIIDAPNDYRAVVQGHDKKQNKKKKRRKIKRHTDNHVTYDLDTKASDDEGQSKSRKEDVVTQVEILSGSRPTSEKSRDTVEDPSPKAPATRRRSVKKVTVEKENERLNKTLKEMHARPPHHESALRPTSSCSTHRKSRRIKSAAPRLTYTGREPTSSDDESSSATNEFDTQSLPERMSSRKPSKYSTNEPERVTKLRMEETVAGLYSIAEELVSPVKADDQPQRKGGKKAY